ncbi:GOLPH3/VPS74 family protein [Dactylosporangium darangshiense]|uniref:GPP34 family phosphoprotein n=1 Tax=Dactylosporangium darangshiense TaxID=579108 RepID=A0ABP8DUU6_9ACTN
MAPLDPRLPPADAFYFIAYEATRRRRSGSRVVRIGLGAAVLGELVMAGGLAVDGGGRVHVRQRALPDPLLRDVLDLMVMQPQHRELSVWMAFLAEEAEDWIVRRLRQQRLVHDVVERRLIGSVRVTVPADANEAAWESLRLERLLNTRTPMVLADSFLTGLVAATGLINHVLWNPETSVVGRAVVPDVIAALPPELLAVVRQCEAAVGQTVLAPRPA